MDAAAALFQARLAAQDGEAVEKGAESVANHLELASIVVGNVMKRVVAGEAQPTVQDGLRAAQILARASDNDSDVLDEQRFVFILSRLAEAAREVMDEHQLDTFRHRVMGDPVLSVLMSDGEP